MGVTIFSGALFQVSCLNDCDEDEFLRYTSRKEFIFIAIRVKLGLVICFKLRLVVRIKLVLE